LDLPEPLIADQMEAPGRRARGLSRPLQAGIICLLAAAVGIGWLAVPRWLATVPQADTEAAAAVPDGAFRPTPQQWAALTIAPAQERMFRPEQQTEGKIANDDDLTTQVFSPFTGRVTKLFARAGDHVNAGDPLLAVQAAEFVQAQNDLISAAATLATARAQLTLAQTNEKRNHALVEAQGGALKDWQQSQVDLANAQGGLRSAEIALTAVRNRLRILGKTDAEIDAMQHATDLQRFAPEVPVLAPVSGTVVLRQVGVGQNIVSQASGGSNPVFSIGDISRVWLVANARETDVPLIRLGDPVEVRVPAYPGRIFKARISFVAPSLDPVTHRLPVRAEVENPDGALKPEMFASFRIIIGNAVTAPAVPEGAVVFEGDSAHVWVADPKTRTIAVRPVQVGMVSGGMIQVTEGLRPQEQVVTRGGLFIDRAATGD
jgi:cobalt-zinc-cadmium efflux system membrane fusion protein